MSLTRKRSLGSSARESDTTAVTGFRAPASRPNQRLKLTPGATGQRRHLSLTGESATACLRCGNRALQGGWLRVTDLRGLACGNGAAGFSAAADSETHAALLSLIKK